MYFKDNYRLIAVGLNKQKALDSDPRGIQEIVFQWVVGGVDNTKIRLCSWKIKRNSVIILQKNSESFVNNINGWIQ